MKVINDLLGEAWAMEPGRLREFVTQLSEMSLTTDAKTTRALRRLMPGGDGVDYDIEGGTAVIPVEGVLLKSVPWILEMFGVNATSTTGLMDALADARANEEVENILLAIDSSGGTVAGVQELADAIYEARDEKPVHAHIDNLGTSAAYWLASQAERVTANQAALVGSIGVYVVLRDTSRAAEKEGVKVHVISSGEHKGVGVDGMSITETQLGAYREYVEDIAGIFMGAVSRGRGCEGEYAEDLATGKVWVAGQAETLGLIDGVCSMRQAISGMGPGASADRGDEHNTIIGGSEMDLTDEEKRTIALEALPGLSAEELAEHCPLTLSKVESDAAVEAEKGIRERAVRYKEMGGAEHAVAALDAIIEGKDDAAFRADIVAAQQTELKKLRAENERLKDGETAAGDGEQSSEHAVLDSVEKDKADYAASEELREEFREEAAYLAFQKAEREGKARRISRK